MLNSLKKLTYLVTFLILFFYLGCPPVFAQEGNIDLLANRTRFGIKAGAQATHFTGWGLTQYHTLKPGFQLGVYLQKPGFLNSLLQYELMYSQKGFKFQVNLPNEGLTELDARLHYMEGNAVMKFKITDRFRLYPGVQLAVLLDSKARFPRVPSITHTEYKDPNVAELGLIAGAFYQFNHHLSLDARFSRGVLRMDSGTPPNMAFSLGMEYSFNR